MIVILTDDEVREALARAVEEKTSHLFGEVDLDNSHFEVTAVDREVEDIESVQFVVNFGE